MRTDVKYGVIIAVCVILLIGAWWVVVRRDGGKPADQAEKPGGGEETTLVGVIPADEPITPPAREDSAPAPETGPGLITVDYGSDLTTEDTSPATPPATEPPSPTTDLTGLAGHDPLAPAPPPGEPEAATARLPGAGVVTPTYTDPLAPPSATAAGVGKTYKVRDGDTYWDIAVREYGDGKLAGVIQEANPKVGPRELKPDMTIRIPPKPASTPAATGAGTSALAHGKVHVDPVTGKKFYVVKAGDQGFWDISKAVFTDGKHYLAIQKANPDINPRRLHAGDKVWIPSLPTTPAASPRVAARTSTPPTRTASRRPPSMAATVHIKTGAPTRQKLPDGTWFD